MSSSKDIGQLLVNGVGEVSEEKVYGQMVVDAGELKH